MCERGGVCVTLSGTLSEAHAHLSSFRGSDSSLCPCRTSSRLLRALSAPGSVWFGQQAAANDKWNVLDRHEKPQNFWQKHQTAQLNYNFFGNLYSRGGEEAWGAARGGHKGRTICLPIRWCESPPSTQSVASFPTCTRSRRGACCTCVSRTVGPVPGLPWAGCAPSSFVRCNATAVGHGDPARVWVWV